MSLFDATKIQQRQAELRGSPFLKLAAAGPFLFALLLVCGTLSSVLHRHVPGQQTSEPGLPPLLVLSTLVSLAWWFRRRRRRLALFEIENLKRRRRLEAEEENRRR
jgi:hypothetical protein